MHRNRKPCASKTKPSAAKNRTAKSTKSKSSPASGGSARGAASRKRLIEQYDHKDKKRVNNPPVGLVTAQTDKEAGKKTYAYDPHIDPALQFVFQRSQIEKIIDEGLSAATIEQVKAALTELKKRQEPYLNWAGKAEHTSFEVPTISLHVHERIDPKTIIEAVQKRSGESTSQGNLFFNLKEENPPLREAIEFYKHSHNWSNRLIAGDSLLVMNSLIEKEGLAGQVQMVYMDPPYGISYKSNFQPFVHQRVVKEGKDEDLSQEPEMIKAFRDTWELGTHSYLAYLRDRLLLCRDILADSGAVFVQISDENLHHVREILDEIFGSKNFVAIITFKTKKMTFGTTRLESIGDHILFYARQREKLKFRPLFVAKDWRDDPHWRYIELPNGERRTMSSAERSDFSKIPDGSRVFIPLDLRPSGFNEGADFEFEFDGKVYHPGLGKSWKTSRFGMENIAAANRLYATRTALTYVLYHDDFPVSRIANFWTDTEGAYNPTYVVQTSVKIIQRCMLMTTDPGDMVLDPTCGSGTTAYVAEQWGRRWITCDTSRVAITLAKQRLMTAIYDFYELAYPQEGVSSGFKYKTVPHITLKSIANNEPPGQETLYDEPYVDSSIARVSGPFTVEAVPAPMVKQLAEVTIEQSADESVARTGETFRQSEWKDELFKTGIRGKGGQRIEFSRVETLPGTRYLHADAETKESKPQRVAVSFGPEHAPLEQKQVEAAIEEAQKLVPRPEIVVFAAFQFDPEAAKDIDETDWPGVTLLKAQMNTDLLTEDLKKKRASNESFWLIGQPDIVIRKITERGKSEVKYQIELLGFDYYNTKSGAVESGGTEKIAMWMLDTDYDGRSLFPRQVFFPMAGPKEGWAKLAKNLKAEIDTDLIEKYRGTVSLEFEAGEHKRIAVKIIDDRGIESMVVKDFDL